MEPRYYARHSDAGRVYFIPHVSNRPNPSISARDMSRKKEHLLSTAIPEFGERRQERAFWANTIQ